MVDTCPAKASVRSWCHAGKGKLQLPLPSCSRIRLSMLHSADIAARDAIDSCRLSMRDAMILF
jgi:hypothetical protein